MNAQQLKNSILQMAVSGKLVPQNPNDEPASILLERIRKEKEKLIKEGKIKKEKTPSYIFRGADNTPYEKVGKNEPVSIADDIPFEIPDSWEWCRLGMISTYAQTKKKINAKDANPEMWGLDLEDIEKGGRLLARLTVRERKAIGDKTYFEKGDILYSKLRPYLLKILIADKDGICTPEIVPFKVYGGIEPEYIVAYLQSPYVDSAINAATYGIKMPRAGTETMTSLLVPVPPLSEQCRIVQKLKELYPFIQKYDTCEQSLKTLNSDFPDQLKKSILQLAVQGKLVPQDSADEPASVLVERIRAEKERLITEGKIKRDKNESVIFRRDNSHYEKLGSVERCIDDEIPFDVPDSWTWCRLGHILLRLSDGTHSTPKYQLTGIPFLSVKDISHGVLDFSSCKYISEPEHKDLYSRCNPEYGDILLTKVGTTGIPAIVDTANEFSLFVSVALLKFNQNLLYNKFLLYEILSPLVQKQAEENTRGVGNKNWVMRDISKTLIVIPPIEEQYRIVDMIERILPYCNRI